MSTYLLLGAIWLVLAVVVAPAVGAMLGREPYDADEWAAWETQWSDEEAP